MDAMWLAFETLANNMTPAINGDIYIYIYISMCVIACFFDGCAVIHPVGAPAAISGRSQGRTLPQWPAWQTGPRNIPLVRNVHNSFLDCLDPWLDTASNCWPLEDHHYAEVHAVCMPIQLEDPPLWSGLLSSSARATALSQNRGHCLNCHEDSHSLRQCRPPFQYLSGILNPDLGTLGDDGAAFRRWQERMTRHRRENTSRPNKHNHKTNRRHPGHPRGKHNGQGQQQNRLGDGYNTQAERGPQQSNSGYHGGGLTAPVSYTPAPTSGVRYGASLNSDRNPNGRQPVTFPAGN